MARYGSYHALVPGQGEKTNPVVWNGPSTAEEVSACNEHFAGICLAPEIFIESKF